MTTYDERVRRLEDRDGEGQFARDLDIFRYERRWPEDPRAQAELVAWFAVCAEFRSQTNQGGAEGAHARMRLAELAEDHDPRRAAQARSAILRVVGVDAEARGLSTSPCYEQGDRLALELAAPCP